MWEVCRGTMTGLFRRGRSVFQSKETVSQALRMRRLRRLRRRPGPTSFPSAQHGNPQECREEDECGERREREIAARPRDSEALSAPEHAEGRQQYSNGQLQ